ncbi:MAG TPA: ERF family protein [Candidatus Absconditabacterales bacterium]|nr:ERF family protein [Candidatus Absconditabacterales bacterium]
MAEKKEETKTLFQKLLQLQSMNITVEKNGINPHFKSKYILLDDIVSTYAGPLSECGLFVFHFTEIADDTNYLVTRLIDVDKPSDFIETRFPLPKTGTAQSMGSNLTYSKRYSLGQLLNITTDMGDDDGNSAGEIKKEKLTSTVIDKVKEAIKSGSYTKTFTECLEDLNKKYIVSDEQKKIVEGLFIRTEEKPHE